MLSPIHSPPPYLPLVYSSNLNEDPSIVIDRFQSHLNGPFGPHPVASQPMVQMPVGTYPISLGDAVAFQDHMVIM